MNSSTGTTLTITEASLGNYTTNTCIYDSNTIGGAVYGTAGGIYTIPSVWYYPSYSTVVSFDQNQINIEKVENGFIVKYQYKTYVSTNTLNLNKLVNKLLLTKENK